MIFILGGMAGFSVEHLLLPVLAQSNFCQRWQFFKNFNRQTTVINRTEEIKISEDIAWQKVADGAWRSLVGIKALSNKKVMSQATGLILTSDGLITMPSNLATQDRSYILNYEGQDIAADLFWHQATSTFALLKIDKVNLAVLPLASLDKLSLGSPLVLSGVSLDEQGNWTNFINQGIVSKFSGDGLSTNIHLDGSITNGSVLLNLTGEVVGLNSQDISGKPVIFDSQKIRSLLEESLKRELSIKY